VGAVLPSELTEARLELHFAAQIVSAPGTTWLPPKPDFSHSNLGWDDRLGLLASRRAGSASRRAALVFESLEIAVLGGGTERASFQLAGVTTSEALSWLHDRMDPVASALELPSHEMPSHPLADGVPFSEGGPAARSELAAWFSNASSVLRAAVAEQSGASLVRCWPHHFDVASLVTLDPHEDPEEARSIGMGLSPGDDFYDEPYFYVNPWPRPSADALPPMAGGGAHWHTEAWTGLVLTAGAILLEAPSRRSELVARTLRDGLAACHRLLSR
jgi:hypothetical protein